MLARIWMGLKIFGVTFLFALLYGLRMVTRAIHINPYIYPWTDTVPDLFETQDAYTRIISEIENPPANRSRPGQAALTPKLPKIPWPSIKYSALQHFSKDQIP